MKKRDYSTPARQIQPLMLLFSGAALHPRPCRRISSAEDNPKPVQELITAIELLEKSCEYWAPNLLRDDLHSGNNVRHE